MLEYALMSVMIDVGICFNVSECQMLGYALTSVIDVGICFNVSDRCWDML